MKKIYYLMEVRQLDRGANWLKVFKGSFLNIPLHLKYKFNGDFCLKMVD